MGKGLIFFCCACCILALTIINLCIGPIISGRDTLYYGKSWGTLNCDKERDNYKDAKDILGKDDDDSLKYGAKWALDECIRMKGMHDMEYTSFIFDIVIGFVCGFLGLLHLLDVSKTLVPKTGLIGLGCGIVGFILTFVYVILNGLVYTTVDTGIYKRDKDHAFAKKDGNDFKCLFFDNEYNQHSIMATISDLINKQYNYDKDWDKNIDPICIIDVNSNPLQPTNCASQETFPAVGSTCNYLYIDDGTDEIINKDISDRFLTALILSLLVCLANLSLALFGFFLFNKPDQF